MTDTDKIDPIRSATWPKLVKRRPPEDEREKRRHHEDKDEPGEDEEPPPGGRGRPHIDIRI